MESNAAKMWNLHLKARAAGFFFKETDEKKEEEKKLVLHMGFKQNVNSFQIKRRYMSRRI